jgi:protein-S-isoprenylcysteine O-methyltransferase Ste14
MYQENAASMPQRLVLAAAAGAWLLLVWWLLAAGGLAALDQTFGWTLRSGDEPRRICLAVALTIYFVRILFTEFVFLRRGVPWSEALTIALWLLFLFLFLGFEAGTNPAPLGVASLFGALFFAFGSWMNTYAEFTRHLWKQQPQHRGQLYTAGLFRYSRHPNYLGDLVSFSGLCLLSGRWVTAIIPVLMFSGFVFANIPMLDAHLHDHYGEAFDAYAARTPKLIPFLY